MEQAENERGEAPGGNDRTGRLPLPSEGVPGQGQAADEDAVERHLALRVILLGAGHGSLFALVYWVAFGLRFDFPVPPAPMATFYATVGWVLALKLAVFYFSGHYHGWWRYVTLFDLIALLRASLLSLLAIVLCNHFIDASSHIPRTVLVLDTLITILALGALRASWRLLREQLRPIFAPQDCRGALLVGADHSAALLAHQIQTHPQSRYRIRGLLDTNGGTTIGSRLGGIPVLGGVRNVKEIAAACRITDVLIVAGSLPGNRLRQLMSVCDAAGLSLKIIPPAEDLFDGDRRVPIRDVGINDLLRREPVTLDVPAIGALLEGHTVVVTGAGGSIGSEICRQALRFRPATLVLAGRGENRIFAIERELRLQDTPCRLIPFIGDVVDQRRMRQLFERFAPDVVFHAAAHKHVPLMEANCGQAVRNNVLGTKRLADLADEFGVGAFVFISTDKAVRPTSVMGATKHIAERYIYAVSQDSSTRFSVVRFGNVLGSVGSVVPIFQEQIRRGGPITITDPRMVRFFMTIPEASQLVLQAAAMGKGGEVFVLDMGEPVRIIDLARDLIRLSGLPEDTIEIAFTGMRPGEKLYEELQQDDEETLPTHHPKVRVAYQPPYSAAEVGRSIAELALLIQASDAQIRDKLAALIPDYRPFAETTCPAPAAEAEVPAGHHLSWSVTSTEGT